MLPPQSTSTTLRPRKRSGSASRAARPAAPAPSATVFSTVIGDNGGNIIEVNHNRLALDVPAKGAEFDITIETRDALHTQDILAALTAAGFPPRTN